MRPLESALVLGFLLPAVVLAQAKQDAHGTPNLTVTYLAHGGFLLGAGDQKILVDALTESSPEWKFRAPSAETREKMERGLPPFDNVGVVLISHDHIDHHRPSSTARFLVHHPKAAVVTTPEVRDRMKKELPDFEKTAAQLVVPELEWKQSTTRDVGRLRLEIARLKHGDDKEWPSIVYAFLFELGGKRVLYAAGTGGHFPEEYAALAYATRGIDLAFLCPDLMVRRGGQGGPEVNGPGIELLTRLIAPKRPIMMHVRPDRLPYVESVWPELQKQLPEVMLFKRELESRTF
jgi:L-ascorbate metabolism protein UlaG (beta-lactamase superfamily)